MKITADAYSYAQRQGKADYFGILHSKKTSQQAENQEHHVWSARSISPYAYVTQAIANV